MVGGMISVDNQWIICLCVKGIEKTFKRVFYIWCNLKIISRRELVLIANENKHYYFTLGYGHICDL